MKRTPLALGLLAAITFAGSATAGVLYDSTGSPRYFDPLDPSPLSVTSLDPGHIIWDDAPINVNALANPFVEVTRLTFDILRIPNAPAVDIDVYWANMVPDAGANRGLTNSPPFDSPVNDPGSANFVQRVHLDANGATGVRQFISVGNGSDVLFTTDVLDQSTADAQYVDGITFNYPVGTHPGYGYFFVGLKMSSAPVEDNLWVLASNPNNLFWFTEDWQDADPSTIDDFYFGLDSQLQPIAGTGSMKIEGSVVPEPASLATLGISALGLLARRRRVA